MYAFYPCAAGGASETLACLDLKDDAEACAWAVLILEEHRESSEVDVWEGDRRVTTRRRVHPDLYAVLSRT